MRSSGGPYVRACDGAMTHYTSTEEGLPFFSPLRMDACHFQNYLMPTFQNYLSPVPAVNGLIGTVKETLVFLPVLSDS